MLAIGILLTAIDFALQALLLVIFVNALLSWVRPDPGNPIVVFLGRVSGFVCDPVRRLFPTAYAGIDFAPLIVMLVLWFLRVNVVLPLRHMNVG